MGDGSEEGDHERTDAGESLRCAACGSRVDSTEWHPMTTRVDEDGRFYVHAFCDPACRRAWDGDGDAD